MWRYFKQTVTRGEVRSKFIGFYKTAEKWPSGSKLPNINVLLLTSSNV